MNKVLSVTKFCFLGFLLLLTASVLAASATPPWVNGEPPVKWNREHYLTAVGSGKSLEEASEAAKRSLAEIFSAQIKSRYSGRKTSSLIESTAGKSTGSDESDVDAQMEVSTNIQLRTVEIVESYEDPESKDHYALAALDKLKIKGMYLLDAAKLRATLNAKREAFEKEHHSADGREVLNLLDRYEAISQQYAVVANGNALAAPLSGAEIEKIKEKLRDASAKRPFLLEIGAGPGDPVESTSALRDRLASCLSEKGLHVIFEAPQKKAGSQLHGRLSLKEAPLRMNVAGWVKNEFTLTANVKSDAEVLGVATFTQEGAGRNRQMSLSKVTDSLVNGVCEKVIKLIEQ